MDPEDEQRFASGTGLPFATTDAIEANCLRVAGMTETPWSPRHIYTPEILFRIGGGLLDDDGNLVRGSRFAGLTHIEAARRAHSEFISGKASSRGRVEYHFEHSEDLEHWREIYRDQTRRLKDVDGDAAEEIRNIMRLAAGRLKEGEEVMDEVEGLVRILCTGLKLGVPYKNRFKHQVPVLYLRDTGEVKREEVGGGRTRAIIPGGKFVPLNAIDETLRKMELL